MDVCKARNFLYDLNLSISLVREFRTYFFIGNEVTQPALVQSSLEQKKYTSPPLGFVGGDRVALVLLRGAFPLLL